MNQIFNFDHPSYSILRRRNNSTARDNLFTTSIIDGNVFIFQHFSRTSSSRKENLRKNNKSAFQSQLELCSKISKTEMGVAEDIIEISCRSSSSIMLAMLPCKSAPIISSSSSSLSSSSSPSLSSSAASSTLLLNRRPRQPSENSATIVAEKEESGSMKLVAFPQEEVSTATSCKIAAIVGFVLASYDVEANRARVYLFFTFPEFRNRGIATLMIDKLLQAKLCFGFIIPRNQVLFGEPTEDGRRFAKKYLGLKSDDEDGDRESINRKRDYYCFSY